MPLLHLKLLLLLFIHAFLSELGAQYMLYSDSSPHPPQILVSQNRKEFEMLFNRKNDEFLVNVMIYYGTRVRMRLACDYDSGIEILLEQFNSIGQFK
ncbi:MAG: hypothetical protein EZS28_034193 [Streblomastix strix]|uniref:Uncharacterized protein n=1 Tax=Streblomastix strix TaxID=222440 RepID=A0A5J4UJS8_9EUKA|nr:MAG: hypothetical protein EZS28_034193 [Streblomastix strix]